MTDQCDPSLSIDTILAASATGFGGAVVPPIVQTSLYAFDSYQAFEDRMAGHSSDPLYTRVQNPTVAAFETMIAAAEKGEAAVGFASGMAAISSSIMPFVRPGDRIACVEHVYPDAYRLFERLLRPYGIETTYHPVSEFGSNPDLLKGVKLAYLESPTSAVFKTVDLEAAANHARRHGTLTVIDNSWATPVFQRPLELGIDIVVHSASKYLSGHSDTVAGVVISRSELIEKIRDVSLALLGGKLAPFEAFLLLRGMRTLGPRLRQHQASVDFFVEKLRSLPEVTAINLPDPEKIAGLSGRSGLFSIELDDKVDIPRFSDALRIFRLGVSWGGFESLFLPLQVALKQAGEANSLQRFGVSPQSVRISLGLEDPEDLWADFISALRASVR